MVGLIVPVLIVAPAAGQVFAPGPSLPILFDSVLDVPSPSPVGISVTGGIGGVSNQTAQLNLNTNGMAANNYTAAEVNLSGGRIGENFQVLAGSELNISGGNIGRDSSASGASIVTVTGGSISESFTATGGVMLDITAGEVGSSLLAQNNTTVNISGTGHVSNNFFVGGGSVANISGGTIAAGLKALVGGQRDRGLGRRHRRDLGR